MTFTRLLSAALGALLLSFAFAATATAASLVTIRGGGYGHGIGMSQYGAYGMALEGWTYDRILGHYYTGTKLGVSDTGKAVRVLLSSSESGSFSGASAVNGRALDPATTYTVRRDGGTVAVYAGSTRVKAGGMLSVTGPGPMTTGNKAYRGLLEFRPSTTGGVNTINAVNIEDYVRGVVALESPSSWPIEALKAQSVAARTYALTTSKSGNGFEQYADTRSQVYGGVSAETATTDRAVAETRGHVVTYNGAPVVTYFFSTSGGKTEDVENVWVGAEASPWLRSVEDPYDHHSPRHKWNPPFRMSLPTAEAKLAGLVDGKLRHIKVTKRGRSGRVMTADLIGSKGTRTVSGATLRLRLGLHDTLAYFKTITSGRKTSSRGTPLIVGTIKPGSRGARVKLERYSDRKWAKVKTGRLRANGRYSMAAREPGSYRVRVGSVTGPKVRVR